MATPEERQRLAKELYSVKVCELYLGIPKEYCEKVFDRLIERMKEGLMAYA